MHPRERDAIANARKLARAAGVPASLLRGLDGLSEPQARRVDDYLWRLETARAPEPAPPKRADREVVETVTATRTVYQLERIRCGKLVCHCAKGGAGHGPYWYAYQRKGGKMTSRYIGKKAPGSVYRARKRAEKAKRRR